MKYANSDVADLQKPVSVRIDESILLETMVKYQDHYYMPKSFCQNSNYFSYICLVPNGSNFILQFISKKRCIDDSKSLI